MNDSAALAVRSANLPTASDWSTMLQMADVLVKSGMLPSHIKTAQSAVAIIVKGQELGVAPMYALSNIIVIQGKPTANSELMLALIYRDHGDDAIRMTRSDATRCEIAYKRRSWREAQSYAFTMQDAQGAGLGGENWKKYPAAMLRARCISAVARMAFPDSIGGLYGSDEMGNDVRVTNDGAVEILPPTAPASFDPDNHRSELDETNHPVLALAQREHNQEAIEAVYEQIIAEQEAIHKLTGKLVEIRDGLTLEGAEKHLAWFKRQHALAVEATAKPAAVQSVGMQIAASAANPL